MHVVLIEHDEAELLYPFALTHGAWELRAGYYTIAERWSTSLPQCSVHVHSHRSGIQSVYMARTSHAQAEYVGGPTLIVLANLIVSPNVMRKMVAACSDIRRPVHFMVDGKTAGVYLPHHDGGIDSISVTVDAIQGDAVDAVHIEGHLVTRLWQVLDRIGEAVGWDSAMVEGRPLTSIVHPTAILDESRGPVILGQQSTIGPYSVIEGPTVIGDHTIVKPHSHITSTVTGPQCRISGEISASVFQAYSNKQHAGFIGNSYVGEWVNLGAGTTTSNLKNTYSNVRPTMPWGREDSQRMFLGSLIGDHTKTAIGTMLPTGGVYGACSAIFETSPAPSSMPSFTWDLERYDLDKALVTIRTVMSRRGKELTSAEAQLLTDIYGQDEAA